MPRISPNSKCGCGSGKKYKKCCIVNPTSILCQECGFTMQSLPCSVCIDMNNFKNHVCHYFDSRIIDKILARYGKDQQKFLRSMHERFGINYKKIIRCMICQKIVVNNVKGKDRLAVRTIDPHTGDYQCGKCFLSSDFVISLIFQLFFFLGQIDRN